MSSQERTYTLDPVTFEVIKNAFATTVDLMAEQILRTCHSFVIYARDFSSALCDREGNTVMQGSQDIAVHVGTLHFTAKAMHRRPSRATSTPATCSPINDPYVGGTHFNDVSILRPIFHEGEIIAYRPVQRPLGRRGRQRARARSTSPPRSTSARACGSRRCGSGREGRYLADVAAADPLQLARARGHRGRPARRRPRRRAVCEREILRLVGKYGVETVLTAMDEVQDYVERLTRQRVAELPDGTWAARTTSTSTPTAARDWSRSRSSSTIKGDQLHYDLSGLAPRGRDVPQRRLRQRVLRAWSRGPRPSSPTCR